MKVLVACEYSGTVRDAFIKRGHDAISCDLLPPDVEGPHYQGDVMDIINAGWDLMIAHPPCTFLTVSGNKWMKPEFESRFPTRKQDRKDAIKFFMDLVNVDIPRICIENPVGIMSTEYQKPTQYIQPYEFGHPETKKTGLWLQNLPKLIPSNVVEPEYIIDKNGKRYSPIHYMSVSMAKGERSKLRSKTYQGIADAMAEQWG